MMRRRQFLAAGAAATATTVGVRSASTPVAADFRTVRPDHVTISYDEERLERYRPRIVDPPRRSSDEEPQRWHAWIAESPEYDYDVLTYFMWYKTQRGVAPGTWYLSDSHRRDREPVYVYVDKDLGEVVEVVYTGYHWLAYHESNPPLYEPEGSNGEHVTLQTVPPWNHYLQTTEIGQTYPIEPLGTEDGDVFHPDDERQTTFETWLDTGWRESAAPGVFQDPERLLTRDSWWADGAERMARLIWGVQLSLAKRGISIGRVVGGAPQTDFA